MTKPNRVLGSPLTMILCYVSSEDDLGPASALRTVTRTSRGWHSAKSCEYPQELGFRFEGLVQLDLVRLLAHECKISSSINVAVSVPTSGELERGVCKTYEAAEFFPLGHVRFHPNSEKDTRSRELKSVGVNRQCTYLRLRFKRPHRDLGNPFGQVAMVALMAHGTLVCPMSYASTASTRAIVVSEKVDFHFEQMAPLTEEESEVANYDAVQTASSQIEVLKREKARAVTDEDYDRAAKLKAQIQSLESALPQIAKLEEEKRAAVNAEDYTRAKQLRMEINALLSTDPSPNVSPKASVTTRPAHSLTTADAVASSSPPQQGRRDSRAAVAPAPAPKAAARPGPHEETAVAGKGFYDVDNVKDPFGPSGGAREDNNNAVMGEREISEKGDGAAWEQKLNAAIAGFITDKAPPTTLVGDAAQEGKAFEKDLGVYCTACLLAKRGQLREAAIRGIISNSGYAALSSHTATATEALMTYLSSNGRGISDPVAGVVFASCEVLVKVVTGRLPGGNAPAPAQLATYITNISPDLVGRIGDANARVREYVEGVISAIARSPIGPDRLISLLMVDPDKGSRKAVSYRTHVARVNLLSNFVEVYGLRHSSASPHAMDTRQLLDQVVLPTMQNANSEVREASAALFAKLIFHDPMMARPALAQLKTAQQVIVEEQLHRMTAAEKSSSKPTSSSRHSPSPSSTRDEVPEQRSPATSKSRNGGETPSNALRPLEAGGAGAQDDEFRTLHTCQFCGEYNKNFTESNLDIHYVRACPMLCPCPLCDQVTEICTLQRHLVSECEGMRHVRECPRCHEAVRAEDFKRHVATQSCIEASSAFSVCPLCHARFGAGMEGWRQHLATSPGCPNNPRKFDGSGPIMQ